jgi:hypothetical protein
MHRVQQFFGSRTIRHSEATKWMMRFLFMKIPTSRKADEKPFKQGRLG